jgi:hypothetical protein
VFSHLTSATGFWVPSLMVAAAGVAGLIMAVSVMRHCREFCLRLYKSKLSRLM